MYFKYHYYFVAYSDDERVVIYAEFLNKNQNKLLTDINKEFCSKCT